MKFLDKIALNRLIAIITSFIIQILKIFTPKEQTKEINKSPRFPWINKKVNQIKKVINDQ